MLPQIAGLGPTELLIILAIVVLLFGGSRLAGLGRSTGRAIREFKEETKPLGGSESGASSTEAEPKDGPTKPGTATPKGDDEVHDAEIVDPESPKDR